MRETITTLKDSFRILEIIIKEFDITGNLTQNSMQELSISNPGDIISIATTNLKDNTTEIKKYEYISRTKWAIQRNTNIKTK